MGQSVVVLVLVPLVPMVLFAPPAANGNEDAKRLYDDLLVNYNKHRRPTPGPNIPVTIKLKLRLSQIIDVVWIDNKLSWDPRSYGGVSVLYVPYEMIWVPDIVLYNNADSNYNITISTKATIRYDGEVTWEPPAIFKSLCQIDVRWYANFPRLFFSKSLFFVIMLSIFHSLQSVKIVKVSLNNSLLSVVIPR
ncbi:unnamed protein product [Gongylonema pulchrum]|uniref:Neur_chan_LBD domain-containing protein n=1 Tax=Gongylonema pulchrum TaxID=637853 RepID=A0A183ERB0_9BILA|nr:unnamed protein product [Gongylonema pulchrum]